MTKGQLKIDLGTQKRLLNALFSLLDYQYDSEVINDTHHIYDAEDRRAHKREIAKTERLITKLEI